VSTAEGTDLIWGRHSVYEALQAGRVVRRVYVAKGTRPADLLAQALEMARARNVPVEEIERFALDRLTDTTHHQGIAAHVAPLPPADLDDIMSKAQKAGEHPLILALDSVQDPQNLGTLIRTAEAVGAHGVVLPRHRAAGVSGGVVKASAGAVQWLPVAEVTNLVRALKDLKSQGVWVVGLDMSGKTDYDEVDPEMPICLLVGGESKGIGRLALEQCDFVVRLPMRGHTESLNAAVAGSIALYHIWRQRTIRERQREKGRFR
jgi:23S rRNA (guanosine2251-2'-O)-methyltransferase